MTHHESTYLILGGGMAADAAIRELIRFTENETIALVSEEGQLPYDRPPLSKSLITDPDVQPASVFRDPQPYSKHVQTFLGRSATRLDPKSHEVTDCEGETHQYRKLLLATGGRPRRLPGDPADVLYYRNLQDYLHLQEKIALEQRVAVLGSGFIGGEIAASLSNTACEPFVIFPEESLGAGRFPEGLSRYLDELYRECGVDLLPGQRVTGVESSGSHIVLSTDGGGRYGADSVVAGLGILPNTELAENAGLKVADGIPVNSRLQTSDPDIYAAGDVASAYRKISGRFQRVEHEQNALEMGKAAAKSMAGEDIHFDSLPMFYSDFFDQGFEALGELDASLEMVEDWQQDYDQGVVYYLQEDRINGVLLWNIFGKVEDARKLMDRKEPVRRETLVGAITSDS